MLALACLALCTRQKKEIILTSSMAYRGMSNPLSDRHDLFLYEGGVIEKAKKNWVFLLAGCTKSCWYKYELHSISYRVHRVRCFLAGSRAIGKVY